MSSYANDLMKDLIGIFTNSIGNMSSSMIVVLLVFANEQLLSKTKAKLFFVLGYFIFMTIFYTVGVLCFPKGEGGGGGEGEEDMGGDDDGGDEGDEEGDEEEGQPLISASFRKRMISLLPFHNVTTASFYCFSMGYLLGYWANLNVAKKTPNAMQNVCIYIAVAFVFYLFSVYIIRSCSWSSALLSICVGIIFGMLWSAMVAEKIEGVEVADAAVHSKVTDSNVCDGSSRDGAVCQAFRL